MEQLLNKREIIGKNSFVIGDLNIDLFRDNQECESFLNLMQSLHFSPKITKPTRFSPLSGINPSILDHIWINTVNPVYSGIISLNFTDHLPNFI